MFPSRHGKLCVGLLLPAVIVAACLVLVTSGVSLADHKTGHKPPGGGGGGGGEDTDTIAPDPVTDLAGLPGSPGTITLVWTAVGDDAGGIGFCSGAGTAFLYDIRYSEDLILNDADFDLAEQATGEPVPDSCGREERFCLTGLVPDVVYDVAVRVEDEAGNVSALSNVITVAAGTDYGVSMHVREIQVTWRRQHRQSIPQAWVCVEDEDGVPVEGAVVTGDWSDCTHETESSATTDCSGFALIEGTQGAQCFTGSKQSCCFVFTITSVTHDVLDHDSSADLENCESFPCKLIGGGAPCAPCE